MTGKKTHDEFEHILQRRMAQHRGVEADGAATPKPKRAKPDARASEFPVSEHGMNQESGHNKHNRPAKGAGKH